jgi:hypothetical protein
LPEIFDELQDLIQKTEDDIRALPKPPSNDPFMEVLHLVGDFLNDVSRHLEGTTEEDGLLQSIRPAQLKFKQAIRATVPKFVPYKKSSETRSLPSPTFLANEESESEDAFQITTDMEGVIHIDEVYDKAQK